MAEIQGLMDFEHNGETLILTPPTDLGELNFEQIEAGASDVLLQLESGAVKHLVIDFHKTYYYGSTALGFFIKLWKRIRNQRGFMAFCNVSEEEREILHMTKLDGLWPICKSRAEALAAVAATSRE